MTREEAIEEMIRAYDVLDFSCHMDNRRKEAFNMAKVALEQEPSGDLISRQSVLNACEQSINILEAVDRIMDLPSVEQESCEDAISRQAALDVMYELCNTGETLEENPWRDNPHIDAITDAINNLPPVNPQNLKTGHWISHREHCENLGVIPSGLGFYEWCSNCDCGIDVEEWYRNHYNFCPNCGARMVGE